jgi:hypothetical protein
VATDDTKNTGDYLDRMVRKRLPEGFDSIRFTRCVSLQSRFDGPMAQW